MFNQHNSFHKHLVGAIKQALHDHGTITITNMNSTAKRVMGAIRDWNKRERAIKLLKAKARTMHGKCWTCEKEWGSTEGCPGCENGQAPKAGGSNPSGAA